MKHRLVLDVQVAAVEALQRIGQPAIGPLISALATGSAGIKQRAAEVLSRMNGTDAAGPLIGVLEGSNADAAAWAAVALGQIGDPRAVPPLIAALDSESQALRRASVKALKKFELAVPEAKAALQQCVRTRPFILCIEDNPNMIDLFRMMLERKGFELAGAVGAEEGLAAIAQTRPDLVLLDADVPDGWQVCALMKARDDLKEIPIVLLFEPSAFVEYDLPGDDIIFKPFGSKQLIEALERALIRSGVM